MFQKNKIIESNAVKLTLLTLVAFQVPLVGTMDVLGTSINTLKDILVYLFLLLFIVISNKAKSIVFKYLFTNFLGVLCTIILILSLLYSPNYISGLQYFIKLTLPFLGFVYFYASSNRNDNSKLLIYKLSIFYMVFVVISLVYGFTISDDRSGLTERHFFKFNAVFLFLLGCVTFISLKSYKFGSFLVILSSVALFYILQRGAFLSCIIGLFFILLYNGYLKGKRLFFSIIVFIIVVWAIFSNEKFIEYSFYEGRGPDYIISEIQKGNFSTDFIRDRERGALINSIVEQHDFAMLPSGLGSAKNILLHDYSFFSGKEPHNDMLVILVDCGILFFIFSLLYLFKKFVFTIKDITKNINYHLFDVYVLGVSSFLGFTFWMGFSNVLIYSSSSLFVSFCLIGHSFGRTNK